MSLKESTTESLQAVYKLLDNNRQKRLKAIFANWRFCITLNHKQFLVDKHQNIFS